MKQLFSVDYLFEEDFIHSADIDTELFGKPLIGSFLPTQLFFYNISYVYLRPHLFSVSS